MVDADVASKSFRLHILLWSNYELFSPMSPFCVSEVISILALLDNSYKFYFNYPQALDFEPLMAWPLLQLAQALVKS